MIVCPVCEHPQDKGEACDVCGKALVQPAPVAVEQVQVLPELEQTAVAARNAAVPPVEMMPELEVHRIPDVAVAVETFPELERTAIAGAAAAASAPIEAAPDIERTRLTVDDGQRTVLGETTPCRYCGHVQKRTNLLCEKCANAMQRLQSARAEEKKSDSGKIRCPSCGVDAQIGRTCPQCGFYLRTSE